MDHIGLLGLMCVWDGIWLWQVFSLSGKNNELAAGTTIGTLADAMDQAQCWMLDGDFTMPWKFLKTVESSDRDSRGLRRMRNRWCDHAPTVQAYATSRAKRICDLICSSHYSWFMEKIISRGVWRDTEPDEKADQIPSVSSPFTATACDADIHCRKVLSSLFEDMMFKCKSILCLTVWLCDFIDQLGLIILILKSKLTFLYA